jgi:hypothetical protein
MARYFLSVGDPIVSPDGRIVGIAAPHDGDRIAEVKVCEICGVVYVPDTTGTGWTHVHAGECF